MGHVGVPVGTIVSQTSPRLFELVRLRDRDVVLGPGQLVVVPRGVEHCPRADDEVKALLLEPTGVVNTGDAGGDLTAIVEAK